MFGSLIGSVVNLAADVVSPVTSLVGIDKQHLMTLAALGLTVYEISEMTGVAAEVVRKVLED